MPEIEMEIWATFQIPQKHCSEFNLMQCMKQILTEMRKYDAMLAIHALDGNDAFYSQYNKFPTKKLTLYRISSSILFSATQSTAIKSPLDAMCSAPTPSTISKKATNNTTPCAQHPHHQQYQESYQQYHNNDGMAEEKQHVHQGRFTWKKTI